STHAVRPGERDARLAADRRQLVLAALSFLTALGKAAVEDDGGANAALRGHTHLLDDARVVDADGEDVDAVGQIGDRGVAGPAEELLVLRIDRVDRTGEAGAVQAFDDHPPGRRTIGGAERGARAGWEERRQMERAGRSGNERISERRSPAWPGALRRDGRVASRRSTRPRCPSAGERRSGRRSRAASPSSARDGGTIRP